MTTSRFAIAALVLGVTSTGCAVSSSGADTGEAEEDVVDTSVELCKAPPRRDYAKPPRGAVTTDAFAFVAVSRTASSYAGPRRGFVVAALNGQKLRCEDGSTRASCVVDRLDLTALEPTDVTAEAVLKHVRAPSNAPTLVFVASTTFTRYRGETSLKVAEIWRAPSGVNTASSTFVHVRKGTNGALAVNDWSVTPFTGVDYAAAPPICPEPEEGATAEETPCNDPYAVAKERQASESGILLATMPSRGGALRVKQYFLQVVLKDDRFHINGRGRGGGEFFLAPGRAPILSPWLPIVDPRPMLP